MVASSDAKSVPDPSQREGGEQMNLMDDGRNLEHSAVELSRNDLDSPDAVLSTTKTMTTPLESVASVPVTPESTAYNNEEEAQVMKAEQRSKVDADPSGMDPTESTPVSRRSGRGLIIARRVLRLHDYLTRANGQKVCRIYKPCTKTTFETELNMFRSWNFFASY